MALLLAAGAGLPWAAEKDGAALAERVRALRAEADFHASGRLVKVDAAGRRVTYRVALESATKDGRWTLRYAVSGPRTLRIQVEAGASGSPVIHSGESAMHPLRFAEWTQPVLDTNITYEDLAEDQFRWSGQSLGASEKYGARQCLVLSSVPGPADRSHFARVTSWLDESILYPVKVEKLTGGTGVVREFLYYGLRKHAGVWSASQIEVRQRGRAGSTFLIITRGGVDGN